MGDAYRKLIAAWREVLPTQSVCLRVPLADVGPPDGLPALPDPD